MKISKTHHKTKTGIIKKNPRKTKVPKEYFFIVDFKSQNREIFKDKKKAINYIKTWSIKDDYPTLLYGKVNNTYLEPDGSGWNYEDFSDTFVSEKVILKFGDIIGSANKR